MTHTAEVLQKPEIVDSWVWSDPRYVDRSLWHKCLVAACNANAKIPTDAATMMYVRLGGEIISHKEVTARKRAAEKAKREAAKAAEARKTAAGDVWRRPGGSRVFVLATPPGQVTYRIIDGKYRSEQLTVVTDYFFDSVLRFTSAPAKKLPGGGLNGRMRVQ